MAKTPKGAPVVRVPKSRIKLALTRPDGRHTDIDIGGQPVTQVMLDRAEDLANVLTFGTPKTAAWEVQSYEDQAHPGHTDYRVTHARTDSRVASCHDKANADLVVEALNAYDPTGMRYP